MAVDKSDLHKGKLILTIDSEIDLDNIQSWMVFKHRGFYSEKPYKHSYSMSPNENHNA
ncbi:hypothetical protein GCM10008085_28340 [Winogradskyella epiphytica]|nr:hypothetical protein GCM10008085_28340 [Winogradskyella epiphytica]